LLCGEKEERLPTRVRLRGKKKDQEMLLSTKIKLREQIKKNLRIS
jgi:hypothetical protein